jgi:hypothetical protein
MSFFWFSNWIGTISFIVFPLGPYLISLPMDFGDLIDLISLPMDTYEVCAYTYIHKYVLYIYNYIKYYKIKRAAYKLAV